MIDLNDSVESGVKNDVLPNITRTRRNGSLKNRLIA